jgi:hypothetical protein
MNVDLEGTIHSTSLPSLLFSVCDTKETGQVLLRGHGFEKSVYLKDGRIIFATSNNRDDRLGQLLLRNGDIGVENLYKGAEESLRTKKRLGTVLVEYGWLQPESLVRGVVQQVEEILFDAFEWSGGEYQLSLGELPTKEVITLNMNTTELMLRGIRRVRSWYRIAEALGELETSYRKREGSEETLAAMPLDENGVQLVKALETPRSLREIFEMFPGRDFETGQFLWALQATRIITRA